MFIRTFSTSTAMNVIKNVTVIGGGLMGGGIAHVAAQSGHKVTIVEVNNELLKKSELGINASLDRIAKELFKDNPEKVENYIKSAKNNIVGTTDLKASVQNADLVVEAIFENLQAKQDLFRTLDQFAPAKTIFASNTSSLSIAEIASVTNRKDRFGGLHFFSPVPVMKLLEIIRVPETSEETYNVLMAWGKAIGKTCITCKDTPGFIVNRMLVPYAAEAIRMLERGDASAEDIDTAMKLGAGYPMGPIELTDFVGLDVCNSIIEGWHKKFPDNPLFEPVKLLQNKVKEGKLGRKTGEGFYKHKL